MNLKPCPFCGDTKIAIYPDRWSGHGEGGLLYKAMCAGCGAEVPSKAPQYPYHQEQSVGEAGAAEAWNRRALERDNGELLSLLKETTAALERAQIGYPDFASDITPRAKALITKLERK